MRQPGAQASHSELYAPWGYTGEDLVSTQEGSYRFGSWYLGHSARETIEIRLAEMWTIVEY